LVVVVGVVEVVVEVVVVVGVDMAQLGQMEL